MSLFFATISPRKSGDEVLFCKYFTFLLPNLKNGDIIIKNKNEERKNMSEVRLLKPEELGLTERIQRFEDGQRSEERSGSYEWWYFDSKYPDGSSLVIVFYTKPVTSFAAGFAPSATLNYINPNGKEIRTEVHSDDFSFSKDECDVRIGDCYVKGDLNHYEIYFKNEVAECRLTLDGSVPSWRPESGHILFGKRDYFAWLPAVPEGRMQGELCLGDERITLDGTGYHDHNWGNKLMVLLMNDWYWGRAKLGDYVVVSSYIYANKKDGYKATPIFMLAKNGEILTGDAYKYLKFSESDYIKDSYTKRHVARRLVYDYDDGKSHYRITYKKGDEEVERQVMTDIVGRPLAIMFYLLGFRGSYHRMGGMVTLERFEGEETVERIEAPAMWEQMCFKPDRIKKTDNSML